ncbi:MAG TPA: hypothetical protein VHT74_26595 [Acetobacteraceae bacterium]|nr:hypothetical protein [Acetobacteraceae bacterium]
MAITQSSGRERLNIHGAIDLETGVDGYADPRFSGAHCLNVT